jgi:hydrogenase maturation protease
MITPDVKAVANAILYEGYILYPYRKSSLKNQQRWTFGGLFPKDYAARGGGDRSFLQCECLLRGDPNTKISVQFRFLQIAARKIAKLHTPARAIDVLSLPEHEIVDSLDIGGKSYLPWEEAIAQERTITTDALGSLTGRQEAVDFDFPADVAAEPITGEDNLIAGLISRETKTIAARLSIWTEERAPNVFKLMARIENTTPIDESLCAKRDLAAPFALASTHMILHVDGGAFVSMTDPPEDLVAASRTCSNDGCWPVLAGEDGTTDTVLAAPIILYDYPKIAPESDNDLFDGTEIDEILILRILTMTDAEKHEMASGDARAQALLARLESMSPEDLGKLHGTWRNVAADPRARKPELVSVGYGGLTVGDRVRLKPHKGGDVIDIVLSGKVAIVEAIERDFEDRIHVAVVVEDDPGREFGTGRFPGHRFFFAPEEMERVA